MRGYLEHFQFEMLCISKHTACHFAEKAHFSAHFWPGGAVPPLRVSPFSRAARLCYRGTVAGWKAVASPQCRILPNKARWGKDGGLGGRKPPCAPARGVPSPQQSPLTYICSAAKSARRAKREPSALSMARRFRRRAASSHMTMTPSKKASTAGRTSSSVFRAAA